MANPTGIGGAKKGEVRNPKGRGSKEREVRFMEITLSAVSFDDWREIVKKAVSQARHGDSVARKFLAEYLVGAPQKTLDITTGGEKIIINMVSDDTD